MCSLRHIFENAILKYLKKKLVLLVTNNLSFLPKSSDVLYLENGRVTAHGPYRKLVKENEGFSSLMREFGVKDESKKNRSNAKVFSLSPRPSPLSFPCPLHPAPPLDRSYLHMTHHFPEWFGNYTISSILINL